MEELVNFFKKAFGKEKDDRAHAVTMLAIYAILIVIVIAFIRNNPADDTAKKEIDNPSNPEETEVDDIENHTDPATYDDDVNYSYSYTIKFDESVETYLGKKVDDKEKFSYIKDGVTLEYAILNDNYLILEDGIYHVTDKLNTYLKYCDVEKIFSIIEKQENDNYIFTVTNGKIASTFGESLKENNNLNNIIQLEIENDTLKAINLSLDNYITSILGEKHNLNIKMEFANIGTTEDFEIKLN